ncbi:hypothetical protein BDA96_07G138600 [Sorghum bicolor]|uniref:Uncharacterized protein n=1 Tax=Sorghum bicolor TaxID=4558 RepID=A0A921QKW4_SORBI|nr:hypothetical protein BDA96_07G138600 [Sorghum bicolor]
MSPRLPLDHHSLLIHRRTTPIADYHRRPSPSVVSPSDDAHPPPSLCLPRPASRTISPLILAPPPSVVHGCWASSSLVARRVRIRLGHSAAPRCGCTLASLRRSPVWFPASP